MARVENLQPTAARTRPSAQAREADLRADAGRSERARFSLPETLNEAPPRPVARRPEPLARTEARDTRAAPERSREKQATEPPRDRRDVPARSGPDDRAAEARERRESRKLEDDKPADEPTKADEPAAPGTDEHRQTADAAQSGDGTTQVLPETKDAAIAQEAGTGAVGGDAASQEAGTAVGGDSAAQAAPAQPGSAILAAMALPVAGAPGTGGPGAGPKAATADSAKATVTGIQKSGQAPGRVAKAAETDNPAETTAHAAGQGVREPAIPVVAALFGRQGEADAGSGGAEDSLLSASIDGVKDGAAGQAGATGSSSAPPAFADLLGQAAGADPKTGATAHRAVVTDVAVGRVPIEIGLKAMGGTNQFEIRLTPEELGRVDVKLDIDNGGHVKAHLIVERPEALALLTRDRSQLEQALEQAGLRPADGGISFSLRDGSTDGGGRFMQGRDGQPEGGRGRPAAPDEAVTQGTASILPRAILSRLGALDLRI